MCITLMTPSQEYFFEGSKKNNVGPFPSKSERMKRISLRMCSFVFYGTISSEQRYASKKEIRFRSVEIDLEV